MQNYSVDKVRNRVFRNNSPLRSQALSSNPQVFDQLLTGYKPPQYNATPQGTVFGSARRVISAKRFNDQTSIQNVRQFRGVVCDNEKVYQEVKKKEDLSQMQWKGKDDFTGKIRDDMRQQFQMVEYHKQIVKSKEECLKNLQNDEHKRLQLQSTLQTNIKLQQDKYDIKELNHEKLIVKIENVQKTNDYLRVRIQSEENRLKQFKQNTTNLIEENLDKIHEKYAYIDPQIIIQKLTALEDNTVHTYNKQQEILDELNEVQEKNKIQKQLNQTQLQKQENSNKQAKTKMANQVMKLKNQQQKLDNDTLQAKRALVLLENVKGHLVEFFNTWSLAMFMMMDNKELERLRQNQFFAINYQVQSKDPLEMVQKLSNISDLIINQKPGNDALGQSLFVKKSSQGQAYRKIALYADEIFKNLYYQEQNLNKNVVSIVQKVCDGAVQGELMKQKRLKDIQVYEQDIVKLIQVRDEMEKWQLQVIKQLEQLLKRKEMGID
ncbi:hypothetical protein SS50377_22197 [Spironucleus salmonicida]|uniref:Uncharacterized protein n=1 Tax=Spironucleus salmonicida TaxID=348837 RepID=V6LPJ3_9EUKA|nr:hypothetical protein SS50377_22197 [Spironucleus salmonicida]|eukprot:EST45641.1 Hypothetical protein SS50377_14213 [Spironucleus salmonicida]